MAENREENQEKRNFGKKTLILLLFIVAAIAIFYYSLDFQKPKFSKPVKSTTIEDKDFTQDIKIEEIEEKLSNIENQLNNIGISDKLSKITISFSELRSSIEVEENYETKLNEFSLLVIKDSNLNQKAEKLSNLLRRKNFTSEDLKNELEAAIDRVIIQKNSTQEGNIFSKSIKNILPSLIIVRRTDGKVLNESDSVDLTLLKIQNNIQKKFYQEALDNISQLDSQFSQKIKKLENMTRIQAEIDQTTNEIASYLKKIVNNID